jgi:hypothetical protein
MVEMPTKLQHVLLDASRFQIQTLSSTAVARWSHQQKSCFVYSSITELEAATGIFSNYIQKKKASYRLKVV